MCVPSKTLCPSLRGCKWGYLVFHRKRLETRVLPWQQKYQEPFCFFCDVHFWCQVWRTLPDCFWRRAWFSILLTKENFLWPHHFSHLRNTKTWISLKQKRYSEKKNAIFLYFVKPFKKTVIIFYLIGTLRQRTHLNLENCRLVYLSSILSQFIDLIFIHYMVIAWQCTYSTLPGDLVT